jgi:hypothetical protein
MASTKEERYKLQFVESKVVSGLDWNYLSFNREQRDQFMGDEVTKSYQDKPGQLTVF